MARLQRAAQKAPLTLEEPWVTIVWQVMLHLNYVNSFSRARSDVFVHGSQAHWISLQCPVLSLHEFWLISRPLQPPQDTPLDSLRVSRLFTGAQHGPTSCPGLA
ncbi:hypothetical protein H920_02173 [Fukomys damarensis]|uniref:Uncharacterized protein n=1 Tax=Fukomys damarensis TaxID=885580 RepID=A0A091DWA9_FUKDA|nr:hypothetical protein H920_02173 [Fukomys damarensis]